jgi:hypothetical protein
MRYYILVILATFLVSCKNDDLVNLNIQDDLSITTINGTWRLIAYKELDTKNVIRKDSSNSWGSEVIVAFDDTIDPSAISGRNTTNRIFGGFEYLNERSFRTSGLLSTRVSQPEWGDRFVDLVSESDLRFKVNESQLQLFNEQQQLSALFEKE